MFNKTDTPNNIDDKPRSLPTSPQANNNGVAHLSSLSEHETEQKSFLKRVSVAFNRLNLGNKATILAIAIGTVPVLGIGFLAYTVASQSITSKISEIQKTETKGLIDQVNRFMFDRYAHVQLLSSLPILTNPTTRTATSPEEQQSILDQYVNTFKIYDSIAFINLNGDVMLQSKGAPLPNQKDRGFFKAVRQSNRPYISQPEISKTTKNLSIYIATPVKDITTGQTIGLLRIRMPVKSLEGIFKNYTGQDRSYHLVDASRQVFLAGNRSYIGGNITKDFPVLQQLQPTDQVGSFIARDTLQSERQLISYASSKLEGLPDLQWQVFLATPTATAFAPQKQLLLTITLGTCFTALVVALIAAWLAKRATEPITQATTAVAKLGQGELDTRIEVQSDDELGVLAANINQMAAQLQALLKDQEQDTERAKLLTDITLRIRRSLKLDDIYKASVREVRQALKTDRVLVYQFNQENWDGSVVAESVTAGLPKMLGVQIDDPCFRERHLDTYREGRVRAISNIYQDPNLTNASCYVRMLEKFAVKANLVAPIIVHEKLSGLMIAHHCDSPRIWQPSEIEMFKQLATQVGYALEQGRLLEEVEKARYIAEQASNEERRQKEALQMQLLELLSEVEGAASGDLTVRAEVTAGEIGTVADFFNSIVESLRDIVTQVKEAATQVNQAIGSNEGAIRRLAEDALVQAAEITRTLDAVDNMTQSIQDVAQSAQQAAVVANTAASTATKSGQAMDMTVQNILHLRETVGETAKKVKRLGESTQQISRVVALINQISMQTNLLAINAGIEAARAGEEGQGFAVVAEEVGELAARSAAATKEIEQIVENIQRETSEVVAAMEVGTAQVVEGTRIVEDAKQSLNQILEVSRQIDSLVQSISQATASQVETSHAVSQLMKEIAAVSQRSSHSSHKVSESLQQTVEISQKLQATVGTFKVS